APDGGGAPDRHAHEYPTAPYRFPQPPMRQSADVPLSAL
ncbi:MAG: hypothetical protein AVDCRST_MAG18-5081, partial [uncultured Thermomicrobiales bacterium]